MAKVNRVGHVVLNVRDAEASMKFYTEALGMEAMTFTPGRSAFLSFGKQHHDIALFQTKEEATKGSLGLNHIAFQIEGSDDELDVLHQHLLAKGVKVDHNRGISTDHGITHSVYFFDPDGNRLEIFCETMTPEKGMEYMRRPRVAAQR